MNYAVQPLLSDYSVEEFKDAFQNVIQNYKPFGTQPGMSHRQYQTLKLEEDVTSLWEIESDPTMLMSIGSDNFQVTTQVISF